MVGRVVTGALALALAGGVLAAGAPASSAAPLCRSAQLRLSLRVEGIAGGLVPALTIRNAGPSSCRLRTTARLAIEGKGVPIRSIRGNPGTAQLGGVLARGAQVSIAWVWRNWCKRPARFTVVGSAAGKRVAKPQPDGPLCARPGAPSTLVRYGVDG